MTPIKIGVDAGGTLIKLAYVRKHTIHFKKFESAEIVKVAAWINEQFPQSKVCITGGKGELMRTLLGTQNCNMMLEFDATCKGVQYLMNEQGVHLPSFVLTNVGTGTSIHYLHMNSHLRVGGTGIGGGTIMGLSSLLTGLEHYSAIVNLAKRGRRDNVDIKVKDIYEGTEPPINGELTASNFGKVPLAKAALEDEDIVASIIGLVGETVATTSVIAAGQFGVSDIVYIGSSLVYNEPLQEAIEGYTRYRGAMPHLIQYGEYSGATGALLSLES